MKTIEEATKDFISKKETDIRLDLGAAGFDYVKYAFKAGVEFAQRFIPIDEELPNREDDDCSNEVLCKLRYGRHVGAFYDFIEGKWYSSYIHHDLTEYVTHWRPINFEEYENRNKI